MLKKTWRGGGEQCRASTVEGSSTSKNRSSQHKYKSPKQWVETVKQSWKALGAVNARWALPVYPVFEVEKSKPSSEKLHKKTDRTYVIAKNFIWEQLKKILAALMAEKEKKM